MKKLIIAASLFFLLGITVEAGAVGEYFWLNCGVQSEVVFTNNLGMDDGLQRGVYWNITYTPDPVRWPSGFFFYDEIPPRGRIAYTCSGMVQIYVDDMGWIGWTVTPTLQT